MTTHQSFFPFHPLDRGRNVLIRITWVCFDEFFPITCIVIRKCICKWRNMLCIWDKRGSSTLLTFIRSSGLVLRKALKLFSPQGVLIFLCSLHCVIVEPGPFSGNISILVPGHEMPYRARVGAFIILWGAGVEIWKPVCCACDSFSCGGSGLLCLWLARLTEGLQGLLPRVYPVAGVMVSADMNKRGRSSFVGLAGVVGSARVGREPCPWMLLRESFLALRNAGVLLEHGLSWQIAPP